MMPIVTCAPCRPVSTKNVVPNRLRAEVQTLAVELGELVDLAADERQRRTSAVARIQIRNRRWSPRWIAASASTIVSELISSTNDVTDVNGMLSSFVGRRALQELRVATAVEEVRRDERAEEQRLRREEQPDRRAWCC